MTVLIHVMVTPTVFILALVLSTMKKKNVLAVKNALLDAPVKTVTIVFNVMKISV